MTDEQIDVLLSQLESITYAIASIAKTMELTYYKTFPVRRPARDIDISRPPTEEEKLRADQGATGEKSTDDWMKLDAEEEEMGPRERRFVEREKRRRQEDPGDQKRPGDSERGPAQA